MKILYYMNYSLYFVVLLFLASSFLLFFTNDAVYAQEKLVTAKSVGFEKTTVIEFENKGETEIETIRLWLGTDFLFKSFKTEKGWTGIKTPEGVLVFSTPKALESGEVVKFGIKTDNAKPGINWKVLDKNDLSIEIGKTLVLDIPEVEDVEDPSQIDDKSTAGVFSDSTFRLVPDKPNVGSTVRVTGDKFGPNQKLSFYINDNKLESIETNQDGYFMITSKIPEDESATRVVFSIRDREGNETEFSLRLGESDSTIITQKEIPLTLENLPSVMYRGDVILLSGTGAPGGSITATITAPDGEVLTTIATDIDKNGKWTYQTILPLDRELGKYSATISDGKESLLKNWTVESSQKIQLIPAQLKFEPGETIKFNGTALPNEDVEIILENPQGTEVFSNIINVDNSGHLEIDYPTSFADIEGTYVLFAIQGDETAITLVGLGELPVEQLIAKMDKLNYKSGSDAILTIDGPASSTISLLIVDPSDKNKFTDTIILGPDGIMNYDLDLSGYSSGVYTVVITRGNAQDSEVFSVGLQTGSGPIELRTTKTEYLQGDPILVLGNSAANVLVTITLIDPEGNNAKVKETFTNKNGFLSEDSFRIPSDPKLGIWSIRAESGSNFALAEFSVLPSEEEGMSLIINKIESLPTGKFVSIKGFGAGVTKQIELTIVPPEGESFEPLSVFSNKVGEFLLTWQVPKNSPPGIYTITASDAHDSAETTFVID